MTGREEKIRESGSALDPDTTLWRTQKPPQHVQRSPSDGSIYIFALGSPLFHKTL